MSFSKLSDAPCRHQQCFSGLDVKVEDDVESFSSFTSSFSGSTSSFSSHVFSSISGVLSSAMASALTLTPEDSQKLGYNGQSWTTMEDYQTHSILLKPTAQEPTFKPFDQKTVAINTGLSSIHMPSPNLGRVRFEPVDFDWLRERCGSDGQLVLEVLQSFCEQGQHHLNAIQNCIREHDINRLLFHSNFLADSACNIGAKDLEHCAQQLYLAARAAATGSSPDDVIQALMEQVQAAFGTCLGAAVARLQLAAAAAALIREH
uniref:HPt domain-containing protein n=1 Tax=Cryptomonas curvata TaxID=233186 RepID=A0A7S0MM78_9CRYP